MPILTIFHSDFGVFSAQNGNASSNTNKRKRDISSIGSFEVPESQKIRHITSSHLRQTHDDQSRNLRTEEEIVSPQTFLLSELKSRNINVKVHSSPEMTDFFMKPTQDQMDAYNHVVVQAIRSKDLNKLQEMNDQGHSLQICNRFGESLIHMACRRGFTEVARFLVRVAGVSVRVRDDYGRTPLHDACWTSEPNFELMDLLLEEEPNLLFISDKRGHAPLEYVRREHWGLWTSYLQKRAKTINVIKEGK